jgi:glycine cleavage system H lipoate-binding protein
LASLSARSKTVSDLHTVIPGKVVEINETLALLGKATRQKRLAWMK